MGYASTHDTTYTGITRGSRKATPRVMEDDTNNICDVADVVAHGVPYQLLQTILELVLVWEESKLVDIYDHMLSEVDVHGVFDLSPGPGACAEAALHFGNVLCWCDHGQGTFTVVGSCVGPCGYDHTVTRGSP